MPETEVQSCLRYAISIVYLSYIYRDNIRREGGRVTALSNNSAMCKDDGRILPFTRLIGNTVTNMRVQRYYFFVKRQKNYELKKH